MVEDPDGADAAVLALGGRPLGGDHVYADPAGHPFCLIRRPPLGAADRVSGFAGGRAGNLTLAVGVGDVQPHHLALIVHHGRAVLVPVGMLAAADRAVDLDQFLDRRVVRVGGDRGQLASPSATAHRQKSGLVTW